MMQIDPKTDAELWRQACDYADRYYPISKVEPASAGLVGLAAVGLTLAIFTGLKGDTNFGMPGLITLAVGFAAPFLYFRAQQNKHYEVIGAEFTRLQAQAMANNAESQPTELKPRSIA